MMLTEAASWSAVATRLAPQSPVARLALGEMTTASRGAQDFRPVGALRHFADQIGKGRYIGRCKAQDKMASTPLSR